MGREVVIVSACRTATGAFGGSLLPFRGPPLAAFAMNEAVRRSKIDPKILNDIRFGTCCEDYQALNGTRVASLVAGLPIEVCACSYNRMCASSMEAFHSGVASIASGNADAIMVGGFDSMSNAEYQLPDSRWGQRLFDGKCFDSLIHCLNAGSAFWPYPKDGPLAEFRGKKYDMGLASEFLAKKHNITREEQDKFALRSHNLAEKATAAGIFKDEIVPIDIKIKRKKAVFDKDEDIKSGLTLEQLAELKPAYLPKVGTVTTGNSSPWCDGASAIILMSKEKAASLGLKPLAVVSGVGIGACAPEDMGEAAVSAVKDIVKRTGHKLQEYQRIEFHEGFAAAQYLACEKQLGLDRSIVNVNGGSLALGHCLGSTGTRVIVSLLYEMIHSKKTVGLAAVGGAGGVGMATEITLA